MPSRGLAEVGRLIPGAVLGSTKYPEDLAFIAARGAGASLWSTEGRRYTDYVLGSGPMVLGHAHPRVVAAIQEQAARGTHFYVMNEVAPKLAERIAAHVPCAEAVKFVADGTEATFYALRFARAFTGRTKILKFEGAYHGHHDYAQHGWTQYGVIDGFGRNDSRARPSSAGIPAGVSETVLIAPFNDLAAVEAIVAEHADDLAAIILEPVQRFIPPVPGFLEGLRALCDRVGALLIFDEIVTGFRMALGGAQTTYGVTPDLCALAKVIGGGLPLAAVAGRRDLLELSIPDREKDGRSVFLSGTLNGNPLAAAAGLATIDVMVEEDGPGRIAAAGRRLAAGFEDAAARLSIPFRMIGPPSFAQPVFTAAPVTDYASFVATNRAAARQFCIELMKRGNNVVIGGKFYVSIMHDDDLIDATVATAAEAMRAVRDQNLIQS